MPSPSTSTLRSGTVSRFSGGGALEKFSTRLGACCWNGANRSPPNQPPPPNPPLLERGCGRGGPPKLKNCADAGPTIPTKSAIATASATSGPVSVKTRKNDFVSRMRLGRNGSFDNSYISGIGPQAGRFRGHKPGIGRPRQGCRGNPAFRVTFRAGKGVSTPSQPLQHVGGGKSVGGGSDRGLEAAQRLPGLAAELAVGSAAVKTALRQELLQFQPFRPRPRLHERRAAAQAVGEMADRQRIGLGRIVFHDPPEILQHQEARPFAAGGRQQIGFLARVRERLAAGTG